MSQEGLRPISFYAFWPYCLSSKIMVNFHQPSIFQEHAAQRGQSRKSKGGGNEAALTASEAAC